MKQRLTTPPPPTQSSLKKRLKAVMDKMENKICADCSNPSPTWASIIVPPSGSPTKSKPFGIFCCLECSASHRRLGVHITFVRSTNLDEWKEQDVKAMENGGNSVVNEIYEAKYDLVEAEKPKRGLNEGATRDGYIRKKYEQRLYFDSDLMSSYYGVIKEKTKEETVLIAFYRSKANIGEEGEREPEKLSTACSSANQGFEKKIRAESRHCVEDDDFCGTTVTTHSVSTTSFSSFSEGDTSLECKLLRFCKDNQQFSPSITAMSEYDQNVPPSPAPRSSLTTPTSLQQSRRKLSSRHLFIASEKAKSKRDTLHTGSDSVSQISITKSSTSGSLSCIGDSRIVMKRRGSLDSAMSEYGQNPQNVPPSPAPRSSWHTPKSLQQSRRKLASKQLFAALDKAESSRNILHAGSDDLSTKLSAISSSSRNLSCNGGPRKNRRGSLDSAMNECDQNSPNAPSPPRGSLTTPKSLQQSRRKLLSKQLFTTNDKTKGRKDILYTGSDSLNEKSSSASSSIGSLLSIGGSTKVLKRRSSLDSAMSEYDQKTPDIPSSPAPRSSRNTPKSLQQSRGKLSSKQLFAALDKAESGRDILQAGSDSLSTKLSVISSSSRNLSCNGGPRKDLNRRGSLDSAMNEYDQNSTDVPSAPRGSLTNPKSLQQSRRKLFSKQLFTANDKAKSSRDILYARNDSLSQKSSIVSSSSGSLLSIGGSQKVMKRRGSLDSAMSEYDQKPPDVPSSPVPRGSCTTPKSLQHSRCKLSSKQLFAANDKAKSNEDINHTGSDSLSKYSSMRPSSSGNLSSQKVMKRRGSLDSAISEHDRNPQNAPPSAAPRSSRTTPKSLQHSRRKLSRHLEKSSQGRKSQKSVSRRSSLPLAPSLEDDDALVLPNLCQPRRSSCHNVTGDRLVKTDKTSSVRRLSIRDSTNTICSPRNDKFHKKQTRQRSERSINNMCSPLHDRSKKRQSLRHFLTEGSADMRPSTRDKNRNNEPKRKSSRDIPGMGPLICDRNSRSKSFAKETSPQKAATRPLENDLSIPTGGCTNRDIQPKVNTEQQGNKLRHSLSVNDLHGTGRDYVGETKEAVPVGLATPHTTREMKMKMAMDMNKRWKSSLSGGRVGSKRHSSNVRREVLAVVTPRKSSNLGRGMNHVTGECEDEQEGIGGSISQLPVCPPFV